MNKARYNFRKAHKYSVVLENLARSYRFGMPLDDARITQHQDRIAKEFAVAKKKFDHWNALCDSPRVAPDIKDGCE